MSIHRVEVGRETSLPQAASKGIWGEVKSSLDRRWQVAANLAEDIIILGQFAFGREYVRKPAS